MRRDSFNPAFGSVEILHGHLFCGIGAGAKGFNKARPSVGTLTGRFRCIGGIDSDRQAIEDFGRRTGTPGTVLDLFDRSQYIAFHGREPGAEWREAGTTDIHRAFGYERPHIVFLSAPCKGFSGLLSESKSHTEKYQALNRLTLRGIWLTLEAYKDDPVEMLLFENVPRIATRGRQLLNQITALLRHYGYAVSETTHDCGELGGLAQSRKRFLLVARHMEKVPPFLYQPDKKPLRAVGDILGRMPLPGDPAGGPMHRVPTLQWKTWVRLAFIEAGGDWRSLNKLAVEGGELRDYLIVPEMHGGMLGVQDWGAPSGTITSKGRPSNGNFAIADPRFEQSAKWSDGQAYGVRSWDKPTGTIAGQQSPGQGAYTVADPRHGGPAKHSNEFRIVNWAGPAQAVTSAHGTGQAVADPRRPGEGFGKYGVTAFGAPAGTVISGSTTGQGAFAVADPRPGLAREKGDHYLTGGHYGVVGWDKPSYAVTGTANLDNGHWTVADPRNLPTCAKSQTDPECLTAMPAPADKLVCRIAALDGTWHRPFTTLELAGLQSLFDPDELWPADAQMASEVAAHHRAHFTMAGNSDQRWREGIGNAVPSAAATAIAEVMGETLLLAWAGETFQLSAKPIWVRPLAIAISVRQALGEIT
jgi:site-specific DNA-cytosine methylase